MRPPRRPPSPRGRRQPAPRHGRRAQLARGAHQALLDGALDRAQLPRQLVVLDEVGDAGAANDPSPTLSEGSTAQDGDTVASAHQLADRRSRIGRRHDMVCHGSRIFQDVAVETTVDGPAADTTTAACPAARQAGCRSGTNGCGV